MNTKSDIKRKQIQHLLFFLLLFLFSFSKSEAQNSFKLAIQAKNNPSSFPLEELKYQTQLSDSISVLAELKTIILQLYSEAYLEASVDSIVIQDSTYTAHLYIGQPYEWAYLKNGNIENVFLSQVGFRERLFSNKPFSYKEVLKLQESLLEYAENNGYPFASVWLDDIQIQNGKIAAQIFMKKKQLITIDKIEIIGNAKISENYLKNYLGLKEGDLYNKKKVLTIRNRIQELPFLKAKRDATVSFAGDKATINLFLDRKKASRFDFLIGLLPRTEQAGSGGPNVRRFQLTGTFNIDMHNQFGLGEKIFAEFQQLRPETQELNLQLVYPYVLDFPFGIDLKFDLYKRDTSYLDVEFDGGIQYLFEGGNYIKAFWNNLSTTILNVNTSQLLSRKRLPENLDVSNSAFGLEYRLQRLNYRFNPSNGWSVFLRGSAGIKNIKKNNEILALENENFDPESLYDSLNLKSFQYKLSANLENFLPLGQRTTFKTGVRTGIIFSEQNIYRNEQFRIGGNRILRGFDEESVFATRYAVLTTELRLLLGLNSYLYAFGDFGYIENITTETRNFDRPIGIGAGITFETKVGLFGFSLAIGKQQNSGFDFRSVKTHFGYVSLF